MVKQWVQPPINKNRLLPGGCLLFFIGVPSHKFFLFIFISKVFIRILGTESKSSFWQYFI